MLNQDLKDTLTGFGNVIVQRLKEQLSDKKINAGGDLSASLRFEVTDTALLIYGLDYFYYADVGRRAGKRPPRAAIREWLEEKHIVSTIPLDSLAFLIQRKIGLEGTNAFQKGGNHILTSVITNELIAEIQRALGEDAIKSISSAIFTSYGITPT